MYKKLYLRYLMYVSSLSALQEHLKASPKMTWRSPGGVLDTYLQIKLRLDDTLVLLGSHCEFSLIANIHIFSLHVLRVSGSLCL